MASVRRPTWQDYLAYDGAHCKNLWASTPEEWHCPGCNRTKFEIVRWAKRIPNSLQADRTPYWGWLGVLHRHHDHASNVMTDYEGMFARFPRTVICDQCNGADGRAKRMLKLPEDWSFAPGEIARFVTGSPHGKHGIDLAVAEAIYRETNGLLADASDEPR